MTTRQAPTLDRLVTRRMYGPEPGPRLGVAGHPLPPTPSIPFARKSTETTVWAKRRDWRARDYIADGLAPAARTTITYLVMVDLSTPWTVEDEIIDGGRRYRVADIAELEGGTFLELTASAVGG